MKHSQVMPPALLTSCLIFGVAVAGLEAQAPTAGAPADRWTQFRGSPALLGTTAAAVPDKLRVLWTFEAGEAVESSAAIATA